MLSGQKYRISNLSKDLNIKSKEIIDILPEVESGYTHMYVLSPEEFAYVIDSLSQKNQIDNIDDYLNGRIVISAPESKQDRNPEEAANGKSQSEGGARSDKAAADKNGQSRSDKQDKSAKDDARPSGKNGRETSERMQQLRSASRENILAHNAQKKDAAKQKSSEHAKQNPQKSGRAATAQTLQRTVGSAPAQQGAVISEKAPESAKKTRLVDTRTSNVDLSKYDERLENFVPDGSRNKNKKNAADRGGKKKPGRDDRDGRVRFGSSKNRAELEKQRRRGVELAKQKPLEITIPDTITVRELASRLKVTAAEVVKRLFAAGVMANITQEIDFDTALYVVEDMGAKATKEVVVTIEERLFDDAEDTEEDLVPRAPVVVVMGHVDHGKTSLLDRIRHTNVTAGEAGGITQHIGAYTVNVDGKDITFLDTPGHAAFTAMRARGAQATDIAILVVAADDGIMPQTVEAINHAKDAGLEIIVAINKMDKHGANPDNVLQALTQYELIPEEWGGDVICVPVSALTGMGIEDLLENINLISEVKEYKANPNRRGKGTVIEAKLDKGRGPVATVLVQNGTLNVGDVVIAGTAVGRIRAMTDDKGRAVKSAGPSIPVEIIGLDAVPDAGDEFNCVENERMARELAQQRLDKNKEASFKANSTVSLDDLFAQISEGVKELKIIVKADVGGSAEAVKASLEKLSNEEVKVKIIHSAVGGITEGDVMFAAASGAIIVGFNVRPDKNAIDTAERQKVDVRTYRVIYECIEEIEAAMKGMLAPTFREEILGHASVRQAIHVSSVGTIAGSYVQDGKITRSALIRVVRDGIVIFEDKISSLRRFKDDVREVAQGYECGIALEHFNDIKEGDILEAFENVEVARD